MIIERKSAFQKVAGHRRQMPMSDTYFMFSLRLVVVSNLDTTRLQTGCHGKRLRYLPCTCPITERA